MEHRIDAPPVVCTDKGRHCHLIWPPRNFSILMSICPSAAVSVSFLTPVSSWAICNSRSRSSGVTPNTVCSVIVLCSRLSCCIACDVCCTMRASVGRYPLRRDSEQLFIMGGARRLLDVGVYLVLPDASVAHGLDGAAQDGKRVVLSKKPDFDVRKFLIHVTAWPGRPVPRRSCRSCA